MSESASFVAASHPSDAAAGSGGAAPGGTLEPPLAVPGERPSRLRLWWLAARPKTLPAAVAPVLVGTAAGVAGRRAAPGMGVEGLGDAAGAAVAHGVGAAFGLASAIGSLRVLPFLAALAGALLIQIATNFANDYSDFHRGADTHERLGPTRVTQAGLISPADVRRAIIVTFALATLVGAYLVWVGGWPIVAIGVASIICALAYTGGPWPYGYHGMGELFVFVFFGLVAVGGSAYLQTDTLSPLALVAAIPVGLLVTNILVVNNLRDLATDRAAHKRTLAVLMGERATRRQYALLAVLAYLAPVAMLLSGLAGAWVLLPLLTIPIAYRAVSAILGGLSGPALNIMLAKSGKLQLLFGVLLALGLLLG
ncbi:MAG TPA: 1,4-dihydroxy-2-naphthoate polyprenyltransferase [Gemmatimonadaceae bacterium]|nr:1,4-dihydroxy-2-naphthoate polyprenyltransferase [Gemmatimonadaceae bacterium]